jgi:ankyrin repeat protein
METAFDIVAPITGVTLHQTYTSPVFNATDLDFDFDFDFRLSPEVQSLQPGDQLIFLDTARSSPGLGEWDLTTLFPSSVNAASVSGGHGVNSFHFALQFNLPWFQFQGMIKMHPFPSISTPGPALLAPLRTSDALVASNIRNALIGSVMSNSQLSEGEAVKKITNMVEILVPELYPGENSLRLSQLLEGSGKDSDAEAEEFALYFMSNNTPDAEGLKRLSEYIMTQKPKEHFRQLFQMRTPTVEAISMRLLETVAEGETELTLKALIDAGIDKCNLSGSRGGRLLQQAIFHEQKDVAKMLIQSGANVNAKPATGHRCCWTPLGGAAAGDDTDLVRLLLKAGAKVVGVGHQCELSLAIEYGSTGVIDLLLEAGANVDKCEVKDTNTLEWCLSNADMGLYHMLALFSQRERTAVTVGGVLTAAERGVPGLQSYLDGKGYSGSSEQLETLECALILAVRERSRLGTAKTLLDYGVDPNARRVANQHSPLVQVISDEDDVNDRLELLLDAGADITSQGIILAAFWNKFDIVTFLFEAGADIEELGQEVLSGVIWIRNVQVVKLILRLGVDLRQPDASGRFPMQRAAQTGALNILKLVFEAGGDINAPPGGKEHYTALHYAAERGNLQCVRFLIEAGAQVNQLQHCRGMTLLEACASGNDSTKFSSERSQIFRLLLNSGANANGPSIRTRCRQWNSALTALIARSAGDELIQALLNAGADINQSGCGKSARTAIQAAAEVGNLDVIKELLLRRANINAPAAMKMGRTALQAACSSEEPNLELIRLLLDHGAEVNADAGIYGGLTALQGAAIRGHIKIALLLIDHGAHVNAEPALSEGRMALDGAAEHGRLDMAKLLLNAGAKSEKEGNSGYDRAIELAEENGHFYMRGLFEDHLKEMAGL